jgi:hypothetical protein
LTNPCIPLVGHTSVAVFNTTQTLLVDLLPNRGSSVTAAVRALICHYRDASPNHKKHQNNLVRCSFGAAMVSVIEIIIRSVGQGWTFTILGALNVAATPLLLLQLHMGPKWRRRRWQREFEAKERETKDAESREKH